VTTRTAIRMISPTIRIIRNGVDVISLTIETAYQRFRWLVISWRRPMHLGFILSRPRLAGLLRGHSDARLVRRSRTMLLGHYPVPPQGFRVLQTL
jgi:hypothetical protein